MSKKLVKIKIIQKNEAVSPVLGRIWHGRVCNCPADTAKKLIAVKAAEYFDPEAVEEEAPAEETEVEKTLAEQMDELTKKQLEEGLTERGVEIPKRANKATLVDLAVKAEEAEQLKAEAEKAESEEGTDEEGGETDGETDDDGVKVT